MSSCRNRTSCSSARPVRGRHFSPKPSPASSTSLSIADATSLTEAGYVGEDVENILLKLLQAADYDVNRAQQGIIYIDEIDKVSRKAENPSITPTSRVKACNRRPQDPRGHHCLVPPRAGASTPTRSSSSSTQPTSFSSARSLRWARGHHRQPGGTTWRWLRQKSRGKADGRPSDLLNQVMPEDLMKYGLIPEFIGRLP